MRKCQNNFVLSRAYNPSKRQAEYMCPKGFGINIIFDESLPELRPDDTEALLKLDNDALKLLKSQHCNQCLRMR